MGLQGSHRSDLFEDNRKICLDTIVRSIYDQSNMGPSLDSIVQKLTRTVRAVVDNMNSSIEEILKKNPKDRTIEERLILEVKELTDYLEYLKR